MTSVLIGSTGFVGSNLAAQRPFDIAVHRPNVADLRHQTAELVVCAGLPAAKWWANQEPWVDVENMSRLAAILDTMSVGRFVLISTIDVYQPPTGVTEADRAPLDGAEAYGRNRAWFERFVMNRFSGANVLRLPALLGPDLRKNFLYDLLEGRAEFYEKIDARSSFQWWDVTKTWELIDAAMEAGIDLVNVATEPTPASAVADLFGVRLGAGGPVISYDMRSSHAATFGGTGAYLRSQAWQLEAIQRLKRRWPA